MLILDNHDDLHHRGFEELEGNVRDGNRPGHVTWKYAPGLEQFREARYRMLSLQFKDYEDEIRNHLGGMLPRGSFDFDKDVESITVNRWAHGYTIPGPEGSTKIGRQAFGRITIANCDSAPGSDAKTAIRMASRAVNELG